MHPATSIYLKLSTAGIYHSRLSSSSGFYCRSVIGPSDYQGTSVGAERSYRGHGGLNSPSAIMGGGIPPHGFDQIQMNQQNQNIYLNLIQVVKETVNDSISLLKKKSLN